MGSGELVERVRVNKLALVLLTVIATVVGLAPVVLTLGRPELLLYFATGSVLVAALYSFVLEKSVTHPLSFAEFLLGGLGAVLVPALLGILWLIAYWVIYGATRLAGSLVLPVQPNADLVAFYATVILAALFGIPFVIASEQSMADQLYPDEAGMKSAFYELVAQRPRRLITWTAVALVVLGVAFAVFMARGSIGTWFYIFLQLYLIVVSFPLWLLGEDRTLPREAADVVEAIGKLFETAGYDVERSPRTDQSDIDPLLINLDLLAQKSGHNVFVEVKTASESTEPVDWRTATGLTTAAWVLSEHMDLSPEDAEPLLVLMDAKADKSLVSFSKKEKVKVVHITSDDVRRILEEETSIEERQKAAWRLLGVSAGSDDVTASPVPPGPGGRA